MKFEWHDSAAKRSVGDSPVAELTEADFYNLPILVSSAFIYNCFKTL